MPTLILAAKSGDLTNVITSLQNGSNLQETDDLGLTALGWASFNGHLNILQYLIDLGADIHNTNNDGNNALILGSTSGHLNVVRKLVECGSDINCECSDGNTALTIACYFGKDINLVKYLIDNGASVHHQTRIGYIMVSNFPKDLPQNPIKIFIINFNFDNEFNIYSLIPIK